MRHRNIAYLIADSGHGRILTWDRNAQVYRTRVKIDDGVASAPRQNPVAPIERATIERREADDKNQARQKIRAAFAKVLAQHVRHYAAQHAVEGVILAAPSRLLDPLRDELEAGPPILGVLAKDLTKRGDDDLHAALVDAELHAVRA